MTPTEFLIFWDDVKDSFPGIDVWIAKMSDERQAKMLLKWEGELIGVSLKGAKAGLLAMWRKEIPKPDWSQVPVDIRLYAEKAASGRGEFGEFAGPKPRYVDGEQVWECSLCLDTGWVRVVHRDTQQAFLDDPESFDLKANEHFGGRITMSRSRGTCVVLCTCRAGDRRVKWAHRSEWWKNVSQARIDNSWCLASQTPEQIHAWLVKFRDWWLQTHQSQGELTF